MVVLFVVNEEEEDDEDDDDEEEEDEGEDDASSGLLRLWLASDDPFGLTGATSNVDDIMEDDVFIVVSSSLCVISSIQNR